jgi:hypothetical protein
METTITKMPVAQIGEHVGIELGTKLVKNYFDAHPDLAYGNIIGRAIIDKIMAQPGCEGLLIYPALNSDGIRTLVYGGVDTDGKALLKIPATGKDGTPQYQGGIVADAANLPFPGQEPTDYW